MAAPPGHHSGPHAYHTAKWSTWSVRMVPLHMTVFMLLQGRKTRKLLSGQVGWTLGSGTLSHLSDGLGFCNSI